MNNLCILNAADTGATESTAHMLTSAGYRVVRPTQPLINELRRVGLENVLDSESLQRDWGYSPPRVPIGGMVEDMPHITLLVDTKAHVNYPRIVERWPNLANKVLWLCLNGGDPNKRTDGLPWADPPCPVLTHNMWYGSGKSYTCYPPYTRLAERVRVEPSQWDATPICLVHNVGRWGYGGLVPALKRECGVRFYGGGDGNEVMLQHAEAMVQLAKAPYLLHLKKGDTVGYATVEAIACLVPFVCTQQYIDECKLHDLLEPGKTCLTFDTENAVADINGITARLLNVDENLRIARSALARYADLAWSAQRDTESFKRFLERNFP